MSRSTTIPTSTRARPELETLEGRLLLASTQLLSIGLGNVPADGPAGAGAISADGRFVAFPSSAANLVAGDTNGKYDIFVRNRSTNLTKRVSVRSNGAQANGASLHPRLSANGRYVAFESAATNLVNGDTNGQDDVFVYDRKTGKTQRVSVRFNGAQANGGSYSPALSADGRYVAFYSSATNLVPGDTNGQKDVFVRDRQAGTTERVSVKSDGAQVNGASAFPCLSANGRYVAFSSDATNLVGGDTNGETDIFVRDRQAGSTQRVSVKSNGSQGNDASYEPALSADGRYVTFISRATNLAPGDTNGTSDVFVYDRQSGSTQRVSVSSGGVQADADCSEPVLSANGRYVAFRTAAAGLAPGDTNGKQDVFVRDRVAHKTRRISVGTGGVQGDGDSYGPTISADGQLVAFASYANNLVPGDTNLVDDAFVRVL